MDIAWFRDLVICIFGVGATLAVIVLVVIVFLLYLRIKPVLDSLRTTTRTVEKLSSTVEMELARPLAQFAAFVQGIRQAFSVVSRYTKKNEED